MFCNKCGKEIMDEAVICPHCGCATNAKKATVNTGRKNVFAIIGFICSFLPYVQIPGLVLSIIGLKKVPDYDSGKGLAIAGIVLNSVTMFLYFILILVLSGVAAASML